MSNNECLDAALAELDVHGIRDVVVAYGAKHPQLRFQINGGSVRVFPVCGTASDHRSPQNTRRDLRKLLREAGIIHPQVKTPSPPKAPDRLTLLERRVAVLEELVKLLRGRIRAEGGD